MVKTVPIKEIYECGDVYWCNLGALKGSNASEDKELIRKCRPCLIISDSEFNTATKGVLVVPIKTDHTKGIETGKFSRFRKFIICDDEKVELTAVLGDQIRFVSNAHIDKYYGTLTNSEKGKEIYSTLFDICIDSEYKEYICLNYLLGKYGKEMLINKIKNI